MQATLEEISRGYKQENNKFCRRGYWTRYTWKQKVFCLGCHVSSKIYTLICLCK